MGFKGLVTKCGVMNKTATVTVSRWVIHKVTGKVMPLLYTTSLQRAELAKIAYRAK